MKRVLLAIIIVFGAAGFGAGTTVPSLPKDLKTVCTAVTLEGGGFSTFMPVEIGDQIKIDLTQAQIPKGRIEFQRSSVSPPHIGPHLISQQDLTLEFSEWNGHVTAARYIGDANSNIQILVSLVRPDPAHPFQPEVTVQERRLGWEWVAPGTIRTVCDVEINP